MSAADLQSSQNELSSSDSHSDLVLTKAGGESGADRSYKKGICRFDFSIRGRRRSIPEGVGRQEMKEGLL